MPRRPIPPPVYFLAAIVLMAAFHFALPLYRWHSVPGRWLGAALVAAGLSLTIVSAGLFARRKTAIRPFDESSSLVVDGPYRITRNPMYLGLTLVLLGIGLLLESLTPLFVIPVFVWLITTRFIAVEERLLEQRFGRAYVDYRGRVRRWL